MTKTMMNQITDDVLFIDFETRSPVDLMKAGLKRYAKHPQTEVLMMAWAIGDRPFQLWRQGSAIPPEVRAHVEAGKLVVAHNAQFELAIWNYIMTRYGWPALGIEQTRCTMAMCYAMALPGALDNAARAVGLTAKKDTDGRALMLKMCKPYAWDGKEPLYHETDDMMDRLAEYCVQDGIVERLLFERLLRLSPAEQSLWVLDQKINLKGIPFDMDALDGALEIADAEKARLDEEMDRVTGGAVKKTTAVAALKEWAASHGVEAPSLAKAEIAELLGGEALPPAVEEALKLRLAASRFTSISKLKAIQARHVNGRVPYAFQYHAATTGRWAGRGVQPHNFTRDLPEDPAVVNAIMASLKERDVDGLRIHGEPSTVISRCLRGFICAPEGRELMGGDFSSIEGRGVAWLAGEEWKVQAYREIDANPELADMYERSYAQTFGISPNDVSSAQRQIGKVMELAFGYQGGSGAFAKMAKAAKIMVVDELTDANIAKAKKLKFQIFTKGHAEIFKTQWRNAHTMIKSYWFELESAAIRAVQYPGEIFTAGPKGREVKFRVAGSFLWCRLPSARMLCYPYPKLVANEFKTALTYKGVPDDIVWATYSTAKQDGKPNTTYIVDDPSNARAWCRIATYGGKLCENITQAICRDILAQAMLRIAKAGFEPVVHVHDELLVEGENFDEEDRLAFEILMCEVPTWAEGFPIAAGCWRDRRYRKE